MAKSVTKKTITKSKPAMSEKKTKSKKTVSSLKEFRSEAVPQMSQITEVKGSKYGFIVKIIFIVVLGTVLYLLAQKYRGQFLAGSVDSTPITRWELNREMADKYGKQTFDEIVNERILENELKKNNIVVTDEELSGEMDKIIAEYGGEESFKSALSQYGLSEEKARDSIRQSLSLKKMIEKSYQIEITDEQVKKYFDDNKETFTNKKFEEVSGEIRDNLYQQEIYTKSQEWFSGVRQAAKIVSYL